MGGIMIERVTVFRFNGTDYPTFAKAKDAAEDRVARYVNGHLTSIGFTANEAFKVSQFLIDNKEALMKLMNFPTTEPEQEHLCETMDCRPITVAGGLATAALAPSPVNG
jgi:hypothetical protein